MGNGSRAARLSREGHPSLASRGGGVGGGGGGGV